MPLSCHVRFCLKSRWRNLVSSQLFQPSYLNLRMNNLVFFPAISLAYTLNDGFVILDDISEILPNLSRDCRPDRLAETSVTCSKLLANKIPQSAKLVSNLLSAHSWRTEPLFLLTRRAQTLGPRSAWSWTCWPKVGRKPRMPAERKNLFLVVR